MRLFTTGGATAVAALATAALLVAPGGASSAPSTTSSAYGISLSGGGQEIIPPSPEVRSTDGSTQSTGGEIPDNPLLSGGILALSAGNDEASVKVTDLTIGGALDQLPPEVKDGVAQLQQGCAQVLEPAPIEQIPDIFGEIPLPLPEQPTEAELIDFCELVFDGDFANLATLDTLNVECDGDTGRVVVAGASLLGAEVPINGAVEPNTKLFPANPLLDITLNRQTANPDGSFTVDGIVADLGGGQGELVLASTTCGTPNKRAVNQPTQAPRPTPVRGNVPVTG